MGRLLLVLSALAFSTAGFFTRQAPVDAFAMVFWRNLFGSAALLPFVLAGPHGRSWRAVEAQHRVSTAKLTDNLGEQERLEILIEAAKPAIPIECRHLHYLLATPFRYGAPYPVGSRFRRAGLTAGVFYCSKLALTAMTELAFWRLLFFSESPDTPWPTNPSSSHALRRAKRSAARSPASTTTGRWRSAKVPAARSRRAI